MHIKNSYTPVSSHNIMYHEQKVKQHVAECLYAGNMLKEADRLTVAEKQFFLRRTQSLNERVTKSSWQIFLSFHQDDKPDKETLRKIAREYMKEMGLDRQPYLVYRHSDTIHDHLHILTSKIRPDGTRIDLTPALRWQSWELSRLLEQKYGLYQAGRRLPNEEWARRYPAQKVQYGVTSLKPVINAVLDAVLPTYKYTSLEELNAVLRPYQLEAKRGVRQDEGLLYVPLNSKGEREEVAFKASVLRNKPTLAKLERYFAVSQTVREPHRQRIITSIDWIFHRQRMSIEAFRQNLQKERIQIVSQRDRQGNLQDIFYIDQLNKAAFSGKELGYRYSAEGIQSRCIPAETYQQEQQQTLIQKQQLKQRLRPNL